MITSQQIQAAMEKAPEKVDLIYKELAKKFPIIPAPIEKEIRSVIHGSIASGVNLLLQETMKEIQNGDSAKAGT